MATLSENWISEGLIDYEYKKYVLLAYLKKVDEQFREIKLYPSFSELIHHHGKLKTLQTTQRQIKRLFPKNVKKIDFQKMRLEYENRLEESEMMKELNDIVAFALSAIGTHIEEGKTIYDFIEHNLEIEPIGITPIYQREGYAFLTFESSKDVYVYRYSVNLFQSSGDRFRGIALRFVEKVRQSLVNTFQKIKMDMVSKFSDLPNPSAWRIHSAQTVPLNESFLPVSKRLLLKTIQA